MVYELENLLDPALAIPDGRGRGSVARIDPKVSRGKERQARASRLLSRRVGEAGKIHRESS